jgi:hypothetical protein
MEREAQGPVKPKLERCPFLLRYLRFMFDVYDLGAQDSPANKGEHHMQNPLLDSHSELFFQEFFNDHEEAITLIGRDDYAEDFIEEPYGSNPDSISYYTRPIVRHTFNVTGLIFKHPHGATITTRFAEPMLAFERTLDTDGMEIDGNSYEDASEKAIVAKLGRISGLRAVNLI